MTDVLKGLKAQLPLKIRTAEWTDPSLVVAGDGWSITVSSPWRVSTENGLVLGSWEEIAADAVWDLVALDIVDVTWQSTVTALDPALRLSNGSTLEVFLVDRIDPWVVNTASGVWVGDPPAA